jgi:hypothetical protein
MMGSRKSSKACPLGLSGPVGFTCALVEKLRLLRGAWGRHARDRRLRSGMSPRQRLLANCGPILRQGFFPFEASLDRRLGDATHDRHRAGDHFLR